MQENTTLDPFSLFFIQSKSESMMDAKNILLQHPKLLASKKKLTKEDIEEIQRIEESFSEEELEQAKDWISHAAENLCDIICHNHNFFLKASTQSKYILGLVKSKISPEASTLLRMFSRNLHTILSQCQDDRTSMMRFDPFDCFTSYVRLCNTDANPLEKYLKANSNLLIFLLENIENIHSIAQEFSTTVRSNAQTEKTRHQPQNFPTPKQVAEYLLSNKHSFIANIISFMAEKTTKEIEKAYQDWLSIQTEQEKNLINHYSNKNNAFHDPLKYNLTKILFINSDIFRATNKTFHPAEQNSNIKFIKLILNLSNDNLTDIIAYLEENQTIFIYLQATIGMQSKKNKTLINEINEKIFENENPDYNTSTAIHFIKKHRHFLFNIICSAQSSYLIITEKNLAEKMLLLTLKKRAEIFFSYFSHNDSEEIIDFYKNLSVLLYKNSNEQISNNQNILAIQLSKAITHIIFNDNTEALKILFHSPPGQAIANLIGREANKLDTAITNWERKFQHTLEQEYFNAGIALPSQAAFMGATLHSTLNDSSNSNHTGPNEEKLLPQSECYKSPSPAKLIADARSTEFSKKRKMPFDANSHNISLLSRQFTSKIMHDSVVDTPSKSPCISTMSHET